MDKPIVTRVAKIGDLDKVVSADYMSRREKIKGYIERKELAVAEQDGAVVGFAALTYHFFDNGFIELLVARENAARQGVAAALLRASRKHCVTPKLFTSTNESNQPMRALLEKSGFVYCGRVYAVDDGDPELFFVNRK